MRTPDEPKIKNGWVIKAVGESIRWFTPFLSTEEEDDDDICHVCHGGGDSSGPFRCWYCLGTHQERISKKDVEDGLSEEWHGRSEDDRINKNRY